MRYSQCINRVRRILQDETPYQYSDADVRAIIAAHPALLSLGEKWRRALVLEAVKQLPLAQRGTD